MKTQLIGFVTGPAFCRALRERIRGRAQQVCGGAGVQIEHVSKSQPYPQGRPRGASAGCACDAPGLVHVISAMEACPSYKPWLDKRNGHVYLRADQGKCLHYYFYCYFYLVDEDMTRLGRATIADACSLTRFNIIPAMAAAHRSLILICQDSSC